MWACCLEVSTSVVLAVSGYSPQAFRSDAPHRQCSALAGALWPAGLAAPVAFQCDHPAQGGVEDHGVPQVPQVVSRGLLGHGLGTGRRSAEQIGLRNSVVEVQ